MAEERETRYQRVAREQRERQEARAARYEAEKRKARRKLRAVARPRIRQEDVRDPLDDKDNLGESPDY